MRATLVFIIMLTVSTACTKKTVRFDHLSIKIPETISLSHKDLSTLIYHRTKSRGNKIEIVIYYYTSGIEVIKYTENQGITKKIKNGQLHALVKFKINKKIDKVSFIKISADGKKALISALKKEIKTLVTALYGDSRH